VQTKQKQTQKQSYKTHPLLPETEATGMFVNCVNDNRLIPTY